MDEKLSIAIVAAISAGVGGVITSVLAPFFKNYLEQSASEKTHKRDQIARWRQMILEIDHDAEGNMSPSFQRHPEYLTLEPKLTEAARRIACAENRTLVVGQDLCVPLETLKKEIARIEKSWRL